MTVFATLTFFLLLAVLVATSRMSLAARQIICLGIVFRAIGAFLRHWVLLEYYGAGDAVGYFSRGREYAESFKQFDFTPLFDSSYWHVGRWWGTQFVRFVSGGILTVIGPSFFSEFLIFSLLAFIGLLGFGVAFRNSFKEDAWPRYLMWVCLFPSLWYWTAGVGKEALLMCGLGLSVMGYINRDEKTRWPLLAFGILLVFAVRPQVAAVVLFAVVLTEWISFEKRTSAARLIQRTLLVLVGVVGLLYAMRSIGIEQLNLEGLETYIEEESARDVGGRTSVEPVSIGLTGIPIAMANILLRPFPWEATNIMVLLSSAEIVTLWLLMFYRRKNFLHSLRHWREVKYIRMSLAFIILYSIALGMSVVNVGIIARQRVFLYPFIFVLLEAKPRTGRHVIRSEDGPAPALGYRKRSGGLPPGVARTQEPSGQLDARSSSPTDPGNALPSTRTPIVSQT